MEQRNATAAVIGAGDYIGAAIAKKFAAEGFVVFAGRRNGEKLAPLVADIEGSGGRIVARSLDARKEDEITAFLQDADRRAPLEVCIFNIGANVNFPLLETTERVFRKVWEMACYSGFLAAREAARLMLPRERGCIFFTGATASLRGGRRICGVRQREIWSSRGRSKCCAGTRTAQYPRRPSHHRCGSGHRMGARSDQGESRRRGAEEPGAGTAHEPRRGRGGVLAALSAAARCVDLRAGDPSFCGEVVSTIGAISDPTAERDTRDCGDAAGHDASH